MVSSGLTGMPLPQRNARAVGETIRGRMSCCARIVADQLAPECSSRRQHVDHAVERRARRFRQRQDERLDGLGTWIFIASTFGKKERFWLISLDLAIGVQD